MVILHDSPPGICECGISPVGLTDGNRRRYSISLGCSADSVRDWCSCERTRPLRRTIRGATSVRLMEAHRSRRVQGFAASSHGRCRLQGRELPFLDGNRLRACKDMLGKWGADPPALAGLGGRPWPDLAGLGGRPPSEGLALSRAVVARSASSTCQACCATAAAAAQRSIY